MSAERRGLLLVAAAAIFWSTGGVGIKGADAPAAVVSFWRSAVAAGALWLLFRPRLPKLTVAFVASIVCYAGCLTTFVIANKWTTAANAIFLQYSGIVWVLILSPWLLREKRHKQDIIAVTAALMGMALFFVGRFEAKGLAGSMVATLSGVFFAGIFISLRFARNGGSEAVVTWGNVLAALIVLPWAIPDMNVSSSTVVTLVLLGVFQIGVAYALLVKGLKHVTATQASLMGMLEPVCNPLWVFLVLAEKPSPFAMAGAAIVLTAIAWRTLRVAPTPLGEDQKEIGLPG